VLFTGCSEHVIDGKFRLAIPAKYRNQWVAERDGGAWMCIPWPTGHLRLYTESTFGSLAAHGSATLTPDADTAELEARLYGLAERLEMDSAGRLVLPRSHLELIGLKADQPVAVVGARNRLEVHELDSWKSSLTDRFRSLPKLVEKIEQRQRE
jgi:MraZ protein